MRHNSYPQKAAQMVWKRQKSFGEFFYCALLRRNYTDF
jgi:hypothetical protein